MSIVISPANIPAEIAVRAGRVPAHGGRRADRDSWLDALVKLIPGEMILAFTAVLQVPGVGDERSAHLAILIVFTALTPLALWASGRRAGVVAHWLQYVVRSTALVLYGVGMDTVLMKWPREVQWMPAAGALVVAVMAALVLSPLGAQRPPPSR